MTLFKGKYRIESTRLQTWDYSNPGWYFITICSKNRKNIFGEIIENDMRLNQIGLIVKDEWENTLKIRNQIEIDNYVIMPNHFHAIIHLMCPENNVETHRMRLAADAANAVTAGSAASAGKEESPENEETAEFKIKKDPNEINPKEEKNYLGNVIRGFKSACTRRIKEAGFNDFSWQSRYHDRIIRDERELNNVRNYIKNNPINWKL